MFTARNVPSTVNSRGMSFGRWAIGIGEGATGSKSGKALCNSSGRAVRPRAHSCR